VKFLKELDERRESMMQTISTDFKDSKSMSGPQVDIQRRIHCGELMIKDSRSLVSGCGYGSRPGQGNRSLLFKLFDSSFRGLLSFRISSLHLQGLATMSDIRQRTIIKVFTNPPSSRAMSS